MSSGHPVGIKIPTELDIDWFEFLKREKAIVEKVASSEHDVEWNISTIPNPHHYLNHELFFVRHLNNDNILAEIETVLCPLSPQVTDDLTDSFGNLGKAGPTKAKAVKLVDVMPEHQAESPMEMGNTTEISKDTEVNPQSSVSKTQFSDDHDRNINIEIIDELHLDNQSAKDQLQKEDRH